MAIDGKIVIDLWGSAADGNPSPVCPVHGGKGAPVCSNAAKQKWQKDSIVNVYSTTKGATALCANLLIDRGLFGTCTAPLGRPLTD